MPGARGRDFGDVFDFGTMSDDEIYDVVVQQLRDHPALDAGWIEVAVRDGRVTLSGRVGTASEVQVAGQVLGEVLGLKDVANELMVDELHRGTLPESPDDPDAGEEGADGQAASAADQQSDTAGHLVEDLETETFGSDDVGTAIGEATSYNPPDQVSPDGYDSGEAH